MPGTEQGWLKAKLLAGLVALGPLPRARLLGLFYAEVGRGQFKLEMKKPVPTRGNK